MAPRVNFAWVYPVLAYMINISIEDILIHDGFEGTFTMFLKIFMMVFISVKTFIYYEQPYPKNVNKQTIKIMNKKNNKLIPKQHM